VSNLKLSLFGRTFLWSVISLGIAVVAHSIASLYWHPVEKQWFIIAALTLVSGSATVRLPSTYASISISETFVFTGVLLYGPAAGTVLVALDGLVMSFWIAKRHKEAYRVLFNVSAPAVSAWCSANLFFLVAGISPLVERPAPVNRIFPALILFAASYFILNSWLITFIIALEKRISPVTIWAKSFLWWSMNYFCGASVAILFVGFNRTVDLGYLGIILPLLLVLYATFKSSMGRVEDADKHVQQINGLYLSTIETLAMAIDAKDQVTHGHIRRVQAYATGLAKAIGIRDHQLLKAVEVAALLHDMGKLAIPEHILNKPGKLTEAEFAKMKLHAGIGADILSAIDFPYPVVPIVRHHHENWNGTGYPTGLKGTEIPIGARILSVVDCFDALTSDRPYRPALSDDKALEILFERRGTMYDPLVVDTFVRVYKSIAPDTTSPVPSHRVLTEIAIARKSDPIPSRTQLPENPRGTQTDILSIHELARALAGHVSLDDAADVIARHLDRLIPSALCVFYLHDYDTDELVVRYTIGDDASILTGTRIPVGQRLSGWVAANRQTILNSDPALDFADKVELTQLRLRSCLSAPLVSEGRLIGVLSLYSCAETGFNEDHRTILEVLGHQIALTLSESAEFDSLSRRDEVTGLPKAKQLEHLIRAESGEAGLGTVRYSLLFIDLVNLNEVTSASTPIERDELMRNVAVRIQHGLRFADILFRGSADRFIAFLNHTDRESGELLADGICESISREPIRLAGGPSFSLDAMGTCVSANGDCDSFGELEAAAARRFEPCQLDCGEASLVH
jgi:diguanylate cyclase (GGDEF)-like protein/putative nucleotidyltransferase with HDIG domain